MISEILSASASVKALNDILKATFDLHTFNQVVSALSKVNGDLMNAQAAALKSQGEQAQLAEKVRELENQLATAARWETVSQHYKLRALVPGVFVYEYIASGPDSEAPHFACPNCFQLRVRSILQLVNSTESGEWYECLSCKANLHANNPHYHRQTHYATGSGNPLSWMAR
jgi:hypothetical protein